MSGSVRELPEALPNVREWSGVPPGYPGVSGSGREALPDVREWSGGPPGCPGEVGRPTQMSGRAQNALPNV